MNKFTAPPKLTVSVLLLVVPLLIIPILSGCADNNQQQGRRVKKDSGVSMNGVKIKLDIDTKTTPDAVGLSLNIQNNSDKSVKAAYSSAKKFDFIVKDKAGKEVWHWSRGQMFAQMVSEETLAAGKTVKFSAKWPKIDDDGANLKPGKYIVYGRWYAKGYGKDVKSSVEI